MQMKTAEAIVPRFNSWAMLGPSSFGTDTSRTGKLDRQLLPRCKPIAYHTNHQMFNLVFSVERNRLRGVPVWDSASLNAQERPRLAMIARWSDPMLRGEAVKLSEHGDEKTPLGWVCSQPCLLILSHTV